MRDPDLGLPSPPTPAACSLLSLERAARARLTHACPPPASPADKDTKWHSLGQEEHSGTLYFVDTPAQGAAAEQPAAPAASAASSATVGDGRSKRARPNAEPAGAKRAVAEAEAEAEEVEAKEAEAAEEEAAEAAEA